MIETRSPDQPEIVLTLEIVTGYVIHSQRVTDGSMRMATLVPKMHVEDNITTNLESDLALELLRVVEAAAIASARTMGQGDRKHADQERLKPCAASWKRCRCVERS